MHQEKIAILQHLQERGGSLIVQNASELGLTGKEFAAAVQSLYRLGLIEQYGLTLSVLSGTPVNLRLAKAGSSTIEEI
jgi:hypothetical protein